MIDTVHKPDIDKFPLFYKNKVKRHKGIIKKNEGLYIPFGHWHQIESIYKSKDDGGIISISIPWNPYKPKMTKYLTKFVETMNSKFEECDDLETASSYSQKLFDQDVEESKLPDYIKRLANVWKETCVVLDNK